MQGLVLQEDGALVLSGSVAGDAATFRLTTDGSPYGTYGSGGLGTLGSTSTGDRTVIDSAGRAVVVGQVGGVAMAARFLG